MSLGDRIQYLLSVEEGQGVGAFGRLGQAAVKATKDAEVEQKRLQVVIDETTAKLKVAAAQQASFSAKADKASAGGNVTGAAVFTAKAEQQAVKVAQLGKTVQGASADMAALEATSASAGGALSSLGLSAAAGPLLVAAAAGTAVTAVEKFAKAGVDSYVTQALQARELAHVLGTTSEEASKLGAVGRALNVDQEALSTGLFRLGRNAIDNAKAFEKHGVEIAKDKAGNVDMLGTLENLGDAYKKAGGGALSDADALALLGRGGKALMPILSASRDQLKSFIDEAQRSHQIFSPEDTQKAFAFKVATTALKNEFSGLGREVGRALVPELTKLAFGFDRIVQDIDHLAAKASGVSGLLKFGVSLATAGLSTQIERLGAKSAQTATAQEALRENAMLAAKAFLQQADDVAAATAEQEKLAGLTESLPGLQLALDDATRKFNEDLKAGTDLTQKATDASQALADSKDRERETEQSLADAVEKLNKLKADTHAVDREILDDELKLQQASESHRQALIDQGTALDALNLLKEKGAGAGSKALIEAQLKLDEAGTKVATTDEEQKKTATTLADARAGNTQAAKDLEAAERGVESASRAVHSAQVEERKKAEELRKAQNDVAGSATNASAHEAQLKADVLAVRDAQKALAEATAKAQGDSAIATQQGVISQIQSLANLEKSVAPNSALARFIHDRIMELTTLFTQLAAIGAGTPQGPGPFTTLTNILGALVGAPPPAAPKASPPMKLFARGGVLAPGESGIVGDGGQPEIVTAGRVGATVTPTAGRGDTFTANITVVAEHDRQAIARETSAALGHLWASRPRRRVA